MTTKKKPTIKQKLFCHELMADPKREVTQAAIRAGFSAKTAYSIGSRLMNSKDYVHVQDYLASLVKKRTVKLDITADKVLKNIDEVSENCLGKVDIYDKEGNVIGKSSFNPTGALGANKLLGEYLKIFSPDEGREVEVNVTVMPAITIDGQPFKPKLGKANNV